MSENSKIEWTDHTFNPWIGCTRKSPGCANCYAETQDKFRSWTPEGWGKGKPRRRTSADYWKQPKKWNAAQGRHQSFMEGTADRPRVFCASLADWLDDEVPAEWLADLLGLVNDTPHLDWLLLTKRPENWRTRLEAAWKTQRCAMDMMVRWLRDSPPENVWIGTTVEDQARADERFPLLAEIPAAVRFLSCEPLLEAVTLPMQICRPDWIICGGESGPGARPSHPDWFRNLRDHCQAAGVPFFFKQHGEWIGAEDADEIVMEGREPTATDPATGTYRVGKKAAGRRLDGREWNEFPTPL